MDLQRRLDARLVMYEDAGHFVIREKEDEVLEETSPSQPEQAGASRPNEHWAAPDRAARRPAFDHARTSMLEKAAGPR